jgi:predicted alpha/beta superfamily hydrolase
LRLGGSSLGGLVTLYLGLRYTWMFSKLAVMSPSVWWRKRAILKTVAQIKRKPNLKIWLDIGTNEGQRALPDARELNISLVKKGWVEGRDLAYLEVPDAQHTESAWAARVAPMLKFGCSRRSIGRSVKSRRSGIRDCRGQDRSCRYLLLGGP